MGHPQGNVQGTESESSDTRAYYCWCVCWHRLLLFVAVPTHTVVSERSFVGLYNLFSYLLADSFLKHNMS
jgi:hypothetical protein